MYLHVSVGYTKLFSKHIEEGTAFVISWASFVCVHNSLTWLCWVYTTSLLFLYAFFYFFVKSGKAPSYLCFYLNISADNGPEIQ